MRNKENPGPAYRDIPFSAFGEEYNALFPVGRRSKDDWSNSLLIVSHHMALFRVTVSLYTTFSPRIKYFVMFSMDIFTVRCQVIRKPQVFDMADAMLHKSFLYPNTTLNYM